MTIYGKNLYATGRKPRKKKFIGGMTYNDLTEKQREALTALCKVLKVTYSFEAKDFKGHNEYSKHSSRGCPMMNMTEFRATL